jgi:50S ribosomal protein L16 3-hydroxylase
VAGAAQMIDSRGMGYLETWLKPFEQFRSEILGRQPMFYEATRARAASVRSLSPSWEIRDLLADRQTPVRVSFYKRDGRYAFPEVPVAAARDLYAAGTTLYLRGVPFLSKLDRDIARTLHVPLKDVECALFCNQPRATTRMHCDIVDNVTVQVKGSKTWRIAPNRHALNPTESMMTLEELKPEVRQYARSPMPSEMPADAETYVLKPGAALHVPQGYWHETTSDEESVSLHIHLPPNPWVDVALATLRSKLVRDERWRRGAASLWDPGRTDWTAEEAIASLRTAVNSLAPDDFALGDELLPTVGQGVVRRARTAVVLDEVGDRERATVTFHAEENGITRTATLKMSGVLLSATQRLAGSTKPLSARDLAARESGLSVAKALELVRMLRRVGFVRAAAGGRPRTPRRLT